MKLSEKLRQAFTANDSVETEFVDMAEVLEKKVDELQHALDVANACINVQKAELKVHAELFNGFLNNANCR